MNELALPANVDAERYVLGACMLSPRAVDDVAELLQVTDMHDTRHATTYAAIRRLHDQDKPTDVVAVVDELIRSGDLIGNLDAAYLHTLTSEVPTAANAGYHAGLVKDASIRRSVIEGAQRATQVATDATVSASDVTELAREAFDQIGDASTRGIEAIGDWYTDYLSTLEEKPSYTPTPWYDLNQLIHGFRDGGFYAIAADTGAGKTVVALQIAKALAEHRPVLYVSLEMGRDEIAGRLAAQTGQVFLGSLNRHQLTPTDWEQIAKHRAEIERLPLVVVSSDQVATIPQVKAAVRSTARRFKRNPVVVVDYLQLLGSVGQVESRQIEVAGFSRSLKLAAQQWGVPVVVLSQLRRPPMGQKVKDPTIHDLRESGQIANDADVILLLQRKQVRGAADELKVIVAKNRQGPTGEAALVFHGQFSRVLSKYQANEHIDFNNQRGNS